MQDAKHNIDSLALMNVSVDFDELSICVFNGLGLAYSNISHALLDRDTPVTFEELFEHRFSYKAQMKILVPSTPPASSSLCLSYFDWPFITSLVKKTMVDEPIIGLNSPRLYLPPNSGQYRPAPPPFSPRYPSPPPQLRQSRYLGLCHIYGINGHSARQYSYLSTLALASLPPTLT